MEDDNLYTIKSGDTFWGLENEWDIPHGTLQKLNPELNPRKLKVGQKIKTPILVYLVVEAPPQRKFPHYIDKYRQEVVMPIDNLRVRKPEPLGFASGIGKIRPNRMNSDNSSSTEMSILNSANIGLGTAGLLNMVKRKALISNELWHLQKNGVITHRLRTMSSGASHWNNNFVKTNRIKFQNVAKGGEIAPTLLRRLGFVTVGADILLSGEVKASHAVDVIFICVSGTGVGAIAGGIYFIAEFATDGAVSNWINDTFGTFEIY